MPSATVIFVDDSDTSRIQYSPSGAWIAQGAGREHNTTSHALSGAGTFEFTFNGTSVAVYGTLSSKATSTMGNCTIDDNQSTIVTTSSTRGDPQYHYTFCNFSSLSNSQEHTLAVAAGTDPENTFSLDYILYDVPTDSPRNMVPAGSLANVVVDDSDTDQVQYNGVWVTGGDDGEYDTSTHGAIFPGLTATFSFRGSRVQVYGSSSLANGDGCVNTSTYAVDNGPTFQFCATSDQRSTQVQLYDSGILEYSEHLLTISAINVGPVDLGPIKISPQYWLDFIIYTASPSFGDTQPSLPTSQPPSPIQTPTSVASNKSSSFDAVQPQTSLYSGSSMLPSSSASPSSVGSPATASSSQAGHNAIAAIVAVVVALFVFLVLLLLYPRRRRLLDSLQNTIFSLRNTNPTPPAAAEPHPFSGPVTPQLSKGGQNDAAVEPRREAVPEDGESFDEPPPDYTSV